MIYIILAATMILGWFISRDNKKLNNDLYKVFILIMGLMLAFRYGQGSDYFNYKYIFQYMTSPAVAIANPSGMHGEIGFRIFCSIFCGHYEVMIFMVACFEMLALYRFINKYSEDYLGSLILAFPTMYMVYFFSALRQGIVIAIFIGILLEKLEKEEYLKYFVVTIIAMSFHMIAAIYLLVPIIVRISIDHIKKYIIVFFAVGVALGLLVSGDTPFVPSVIKTYWDGDMSVSAVIMRLIYLVLIELILTRIDFPKIPKIQQLSIKIYLFGFAIYFLFVDTPLIASRSMACFEVMSVIIFPWLLKQSTKYRQIVISAIMVLVLTVTIKNCSANLTQGNYKKGLRAWNYPYVSVFNKDTLWNYKEYDYMCEIINE